MQANIFNLLKMLIYFCLVYCFKVLYSVITSLHHRALEYTRAGSISAYVGSRSSWHKRHAWEDNSMARSWSRLDQDFGGLNWFQYPKVYRIKIHSQTAQDSRSMEYIEVWQGYRDRNHLGQGYGDQRWNLLKYGKVCLIPLNLEPEHDDRKWNIFECY